MELLTAPWHYWVAARDVAEDFDLSKDWVGFREFFTDVDWYYELMLNEVDGKLKIEIADAPFYEEYENSHIEEGFFTWGEGTSDETLLDGQPTVIVYESGRKVLLVKVTLIHSEYLFRGSLWDFDTDFLEGAIASLYAKSWGKDLLFFSAPRVSLNDDMVWSLEVGNSSGTIQRGFEMWEPYRPHPLEEYRWVDPDFADDLISLWDQGERRLAMLEPYLLPEGAQEPMLKEWWLPVRNLL